MIFTLVATVKNEGPYLWEWVAYHRMIGFDNIIIFQNDSTDGTHEILAEMKKHGLVKYRYNKALPGKHQVRAYKRASLEPEYKSADFVMALDLDEFLVIHTGKGTVRDFVDAVPKFDCAYINWVKFGSGQHETMPEGLVTSSFTRCANRKRITSGVEPFKSFFRREAFIRPGIHRPAAEKTGSFSPRIINGSGLVESEFITRNFQCSDPKQRELAQVNHYIVKDISSFILKSAKGSAHQSHREIGQNYWKGANRNHDEDTRMWLREADILDAMNGMDEVTGGRLRELSENARAHHQLAFSKVISEPWAQDLFAYCRERKGE